jgi:hypothetical protein
MFYFALKIICYNKITINIKDIPSFYRSPAVTPYKRLGIVFAYVIFRNNDITIRNLNNNSILDTSPEYSENTFGGLYADSFKNLKHGRLMLEGQSYNKKLVQPIANEAKVKLNKKAI